ncbi:MAG: MATE family efflux transporter [Gemmatimonadales bacterium]
MNVGGVFLLRFVGSLEQSAAAQAAYAISYTELFALITWTSSRPDGRHRRRGRPESAPAEADRTIEAVHVAAKIGTGAAGSVGVLFLLIPRVLLGAFGMTDPEVVRLAAQLLAYLSLSGLFITVALTYTGGLQGTGDTKSPFYISLISQIVVPLGLCAIIQTFRPLRPVDIWLAIDARPHDAVRPVRSVPPGTMAVHQGGHPDRPGRQDLIRPPGRPFTGRVRTDTLLLRVR